ncbi:MAG: hypothetical protein CVU05_13165 [Bacteroidetes bacterium HGW-Bacteroidetes-21]|jgi:4-amino-4-deoxy-L-arabinose transferase-like glycosyltransferase|nr:MAG: hypothetical protein CVU05_13165 [Bacteroidetes bacterium HGW-Bacteroidetes-21]
MSLFKINRNTPFWLFAIAVTIGLTLPVLIQDGMFMDAMLYTSVAHNMSQDFGTFWFPQFSLNNMAGLTSFHEQPPLVFWIQSLFFRLLGDSMYVERFYTFLTLAITAALIIIFWRKINKDNPEIIPTSWLPVVLWITIPVCFWSYSNNMHENTMGIFTLVSVFLLYKAITSEGYHILLLIVSGIFIFLATLSKGIPGFFPISVPFLYWLIVRKSSFSKAVVQTVIVTLIPVLIYVVLILIPESCESLSTYLYKRVLNRINEVPTVDNRFYILGRLFMELLPQIILMAIVVVIARVKKLNTKLKPNYKLAGFFMAVGLSSSAPLMLTMVQKGFYFVPSLPFFALGFSLLIAPFMAYWIMKLDIKSLKYKVYLWMGILLLAGALGYTVSRVGHTSRNSEMLHDVYVIGKIIPAKSAVSIPSEMWNDWGLQCYLIRYFSISIDVNYTRPYFVLDKNISIPDSMLTGYTKMNLETQQYDIYAKNE